MGEHVLVIEPLSAGARLPAAAHTLGAEVTAMALDRGAVRLDEECRSHIDRLIQLNVSDEAAVLGAVERLHAARPITAVIPGFELFVPLAHRLATRLGLRANDSSLVDATRHKDLMMDRARAAGLRVPHTHLVRDRRQALAAAAEIGYPAVVKAPDNTASSDVYKVHDEAALLDRCGRIWRRPPDEDWDFPLASAALIQEFVAGPELSVETVSFGSGPALVNITDKLVTDGPHFVELGHCVPSSLPEPALEAVGSFAAAVHEAFGIRVGAAHMELRVRSNGEPVLIEVAARLAGDRIIDLVEAATGVDMYRETVRAFLGATAPERPLRYRGAACVRFVTAPGAGSFRVDTAAARSLPGVHDLRVPDTVDASGALRDYRDRHGNLVVRAGTAAEARRRAGRALRLIAFTPSDTEAMTREAT
ncbi:ATP-grasp domain-containing protein [Nocardia sienata]|uniref:ATP-grasp domain-containing protein n=1 Tax=Nocardia sienata TaxID=248552 RepID=UPI000AB3B00F|nr:ATP-grasp domain-containing protein [Nocardia sienata]